MVGTGDDGEGETSRVGRPASGSRAAAARTARAARRDAVGGGPVFDALRAQLQRARGLEAAADSADRRLAARAGTARLIQAACAAGWRVVDIADALEVTSVTVQARLRTLDQTTPAGIIVPPPPGLRAPRPGSRPAGDGWLTPGQAAAITGVRHRSLTRWRLAGLLPNSRCTEGGRWFYRREDLDRVTARRAGLGTLPSGTFAESADTGPAGRTSGSG